MAEENINDEYYASYYEFQGRSEWMEKIWSAAFGDEYLKGLDVYGYLTRTELSKIIELLGLTEADVFLDIGCGKGGPGLRISELTGAKYLGIDKIEGAVRQASNFASSFQLENEALFHVGEFFNIPLDDAMVDHVMSIDAFWTVTDKIFALREVMRVLKSGGRFVFTNWDLKGEDPIKYFEQSGMQFIARYESDGWLQRQQMVYKGIIEHEAELVNEMGDSSHVLLYEARASLPWLDQSIRYIYVMGKV